jgi:hypothetical protein
VSFSAPTLNYPCIHPSTDPSVHLSICPFVSLSVCLSLPTYLPNYPPTRPFTHSTTYLPTYLPTYLSMALQPFVGPWPLFQFLDLFTQSVGLLGRGISLSQGHYLHTGQHKHNINAHRHPCLKWDSNTQSQCLSERRQFMPQTAQPM